ncbi:MAG: YdcF family protein [Microthrixaceae bacterium]
MTRRSKGDGGRRRGRRGNGNGADAVPKGRGCIARLLRVGVGVVLLAVIYLAVTAVQVGLASRWDHTRAAGAAVVGAAQYDGRPSEVFEARLDRAATLYREHDVPMIVVTGGAQVGDRFTEAYAGMRYLRRLKVPEQRIVVVTNGADTYESLAAAARVMHRRGVTEVQLVSDPYHSFRLEAIAREAGFDGKVSPTAASSGTRELLRETVAVSLGRIIGYRRLSNWIG